LQSSQPAAAVPPLRLVQATGRVLPLGHHFGAWVLEQSCAVGGSSQVAQVRHLQSGAQGALKYLLPEYRRDRPTLRRMQAELEVASRLRVARVPRLLDCGECPALGAWFVVELVDGPPLTEAICLRQRVGDASGWTLGSLLRVWSQVADAVARAHGQGVIHRDLKPANVVLDEAGDAWLVDWGLALQWGDERARAHDGCVFGTPGYLSPEQAAGRASRWDERTDVWGLGALLFAILAGRRPYPQTDPHELLPAMAWPPAMPARDTRGQAIPPSLMAVCRRALALSPQDRHPSAAALQLAVGGAAQQAGIW
jgi:serine/threonine protein kinase